MRPTLEENIKRTFKQLGVDYHELHAELAGRAEADAAGVAREGRLLLALPHRHLFLPDADRDRDEDAAVFWGEPSAEYTAYYGYDENEEVDEKRFNRFVNLGITADDMYVRSRRHGRRARSVSVSLSAAEGAAAHQVPLGLPRVLHPVGRQEAVEIIKRELGWKGDEVEDVPPEYDYEKIECFMQGVRDYIKFIKRGYSRPVASASHSTSATAA